MLKFTKIEFVKLTDIFMQPIVTLSLIRNGVTEYESIFNSLLNGKDPYLNYELLVNNGE